jgi:hypothetical protein
MPPWGTKFPEHLDTAGRLTVNVGGGQRLSLERAGGDAELVPHRGRVAARHGMAGAAPEPHLGVPGAQGAGGYLAYPLVAVVQVSRHHHGLQARPQGDRGGEHGVQVVGARAEDLDRTGVPGLDGEHGDVPPGHRLVE